jgi:hypothetical protein
MVFLLYFLASTLHNDKKIFSFVGVVFLVADVLIDS